MNYIVGPVFAHLFQQSLDMSEIPKELLFANICSLFTKGDSALTCSYRPLSLTCMPWKLLEHIVSQISWLTWMNISSCQIGSMHLGKSTVCETQLTTVIDD